jgi:sigma-54 dependent transcriptional regulator, acetoin dehydrogenase operon transcriptional activator AcoR
VVSPALRSAVVDGLRTAPGAEPEGGTAMPLPADAQAVAIVERLARALEHQIPCVLIGETGSGKEWLARLAHQRARTGQPFVPLPCAGLGPTTLERMLADGALGPDGAGTVYLDEVGDLAPPVQQRLLRVLDARDDDPAGPPVARRLRLVCASRGSLRALVDDGRLREDLVYRLNGLTLRVPALRERSDLIALAQGMVEQEASGRGLRLADDVLQLLRQHRWPGNLRQLHNVLRAAVALVVQGDEITREHLSADVIEDAAAPAPALSGGAAAKTPQSLDDLTLEAIAQAVDAARGNISEASRQLGISRNTIYRKLRRRD